MTPRALLAVTLTTALACLCGTALCGAAAAAAGTGPATAGNPPGPGPYTAIVDWAGTTSGNYIPGSFNSSYVPPQCWLDPRFTQQKSWQPGDPTGVSLSVDADTAWWWFAYTEPGLMRAINHMLNARSQINQGFRTVQVSGRKGWWWVPAWLNDSQGFACAQGLVSSTSMNYGFLDFAPPQTGGGATPGHTIDGQILADVARAALRLPAITLHTSPAGSTGHPADVNLPVWVWVTYRGAMSPHDRTAVALPDGGTLWAQVTTSRPTVTLSVSDPAQADVHDNCGTGGSRYTGQAAAVPACGVTFLAPSVTGPYTVTATVHWTVSWSASTGASGSFPSPPYPPSQESRSVSMTVREIQSVNGGA